jgi:uncharacterized protein (DUF2252 family)
MARSLRRPRPGSPGPAGEPEWARRHAQGKALRVAVPRSAHAGWKPPADREDPLELLARSNAGRQPDLVPIRMGRMAASLFAFLRGSAVVMASDLARTPTTGLEVLMDGDAHLANFGLFGTAERDVVFYLNDFDEAQTGPWEWDLKRLVASINVATRQYNWSRKDRRAAVLRCVAAYRASVRRLESRGALSVWYEFLFTGRRDVGSRLDPTTQRVLSGAAEAAARRSNGSLLDRLAHRLPRGDWRFRHLPPVQIPLPRPRRDLVLAALAEYVRSLPRGRRYLVERYRPVDVAEHVVGVGSVGARAYVVLLFGNGERDPLFLQVKEALPPAAGPFARPLPADLRREPGKRVVTAQMALHTSPDLLLGWTHLEGRSFYVRQLRNLKASVLLDELTPRQLLRYAEACGEVLGHAHARTGDAARIAGYCGRSDALDQALARFAESYGDQVERDYRRLVDAVRRGRIEAVVENSGGRSPRRGRAGPTTTRPRGGTSAARRRSTSRRSSR